MAALWFAVVATLPVGCDESRKRSADKPKADQTADASAGAPAQKPWLVEVTSAVGLRVSHDVGDPERCEMPQVMGSGAAVWDFDGDGRPDLYLVGGEAAGRDAGGASPRDGLLRRVGTAYRDVSEPAGIRNVGFGMGTAIADYDGDGFLDLFVTNYGPDQLFRNNGDGTLVDVTDAVTAVPAWGTAACFADYDRDGDLDLFVVNYVDYLPGQHCEDRAGRRDFCGPTAFFGTIDRLLKSDGEGRFADVTAETGLDADIGKGLGVACRDFDGDGRPDFYVANDMEENHLWVQQSDGTFRNEAIPRGAAVGALGEPQAGMGVVATDLTGDGRCDLFITHLRGETNTLYAAIGDGYFENRTAASGLGEPGRPYTGFGVAALDLRHDGVLHLLVANGDVQRGPPWPGADPDSFWRDYAQPNQFFLNDGSGRFRAAPELGGRFCDLVEVSRGLVCGDFDGDGDLDVLVTNCGGPARVFDNVAPKQGNWLKVRLVGSGANRDAIGATVAVVASGRRFLRYVDSSSGYLTSDDVCHFGIGEADEYQSLEVRWPDGAAETFPGGKAGRTVTVVHGRGLKRNGVR